MSKLKTYIPIAILVIVTCIVSIKVWNLYTLFINETQSYSMNISKKANDILNEKLVLSPKKQANLLLAVSDRHFEMKIVNGLMFIIFVLLGLLFVVTIFYLRNENKRN